VVVLNKTRERRALVLDLGARAWTQVAAKGFDSTSSTLRTLGSPVLDGRILRDTLPALSALHYVLQPGASVSVARPASHPSEVRLVGSRTLALDMRGEVAIDRILPDGTIARLFDGIADGGTRLHLDQGGVVLLRIRTDREVSTRRLFVP
jgi:hypothetical protein